MNREEKLINNTAILTLGTVFSSCFSFVLVPLYSRWLTTSDYGTYDVYLTYVTLLIPLVTMAGGEATFRLLLDCKNDSEKKKVLSCTCSIALLGTTLGIVVAVVVFSIFQLTALVPFITLFLSFMLYNQGNYIARGFRKLATYAVSNIIYLLFMAIFVTWFVLINQMGLSGILYGNALGHFAGFFYIACSCKVWKYVSPGKPDWREAKRVICYSAPLIPNSISWWIINVSDRSIISAILGASFNGIYAISYKLPSLCSTVFSVFHMSWLESAVDSVNDTDRNAYTNYIFNNIFPFCFSAAAGVLAANQYFYKWLWDAKYAEGCVYVWILLIGMCFSFLAQFLGGLLIAEKNTKANGITTMAAAGINVAVHVALVNIIGLYAAAISTTVSYMFLFAIRFAILQKSYRLRVKLRAVFSAVIFAVIAVCQFSKSEIVGVALLILSIISFITVNRNIIVQIANKVFHKIV